MRCGSVNIVYLQYIELVMQFVDGVVACRFSHGALEANRSEYIQL